MAEAADVMELLASRKNVLLSGPPGTGKSRLLSEVAALFEAKNSMGPPQVAPRGRVAIPQAPAAPEGIPAAIASAANRKVFRCVLHQSSKHRDFLTGIMPDLRPGQPAGKFRIVEGILYRASEFAKQPGSAALLIIDEINRGPAVQVFGGAIVAMEQEKRLANDGRILKETQSFDLLDPATGDLIEYALPSRLFILAAMNQADVSVEPLDVAFLRRWAPISLEPSPQVLRNHFGLGVAAVTPETPTTPAQVFEVAVQAFEALNQRIAIGRGPEFRVGHGLMMAPGGPPGTLGEALAHVATAWSMIRNHVDEAFFGDVRGTAIVLNADRGIPGHPYDLKETSFGDAPRAFLEGPLAIGPDGIYALLRAVAAKVDTAL